jgi:triosephosphate isomerase
VPLISGNWKMHHNHLEAITLVQKLGYLLTAEDVEAVDVSVHPPFTDLRSVQTVVEADKIPVAVGAQNCHWEDKGAFTGEVAPGMLAKLNVSYVIVGHSERRELFGEDDEVVNRKALAVLAHGMTPILCVGETLEEREAGSTEAKVVGQVRAGLAGVSPAQVAALVVAYEPIWAIGTGRTPTVEQVAEVHTALRQGLRQRFGGQTDAVQLLYGGSVKPENAKSLMHAADVDGALVGGASLDVKGFFEIVRNAAEAFR